MVGRMNDFDVARIRARMPALASGVAFFDGPGGTQLPDVVADAMRTAMTEPLSNRGTMTQSERNAESIVQGSRRAAADLLGCDPAGVVFSRSMTEATFMVARTLANDWGPGDRVVVTDLDHDANVRPWVTYAEKADAEVAWARLDPTTGELPTRHIVDQITDNTRFVAVTGASNVVGTRPDLPAIAEAAHAVNALFFVDGVHLTAHAPIDVKQIGADFYACSAYKFLGPHLGIVAASSALWESLHPDKLAPSTEQVPERFELGTLPYELLAGLIAAVDVLADLVPGGETSTTRRDRLTQRLCRLVPRLVLGHVRLNAFSWKPAAREADLAKALARQIADRGLSARQAESLVAKPRRSKAGGSPKPAKSADLENVEAMLRGKLGLGLDIDWNEKNGTGKMTIRFATLEQMDGVMAKLMSD